MKCNGFTLAEVLITLAIIGVVAAISIPSVISNSQQQEFKTGLRKAVSVLNSAITMNMALDGETPYDNANLFGFLMKHMNILKSSTKTDWYSVTCKGSIGNCQNYMGSSNAVFYTTDGQRFEFHLSNDSNPVSKSGFKLHESGGYACVHTYDAKNSLGGACNGCGSYGLNHNPNNTTKVPCAILVDVNGDKKPTPVNATCRDTTCMQKNRYYVPDVDQKLLRDTFTVLITDDRVIPYGVTAQKAMYQAQK